MNKYELALVVSANVDEEVRNAGIVWFMWFFPEDENGGSVDLD